MSTTSFYPTSSALKGLEANEIAVRHAKDNASQKEALFARFYRANTCPCCGGFLEPTAAKPHSFFGGCLDRIFGFTPEPPEKECPRCPGVRVAVVMADAYGQRVRYILPGERPYLLNIT